MGIQETDKGMDQGRGSLLSFVGSAAAMVLAWASSVWIDHVGAIGPMDRAVLGGFIMLPLILAAPALAAMSARQAPSTVWRWIALGALGVLTFGIVCAVVALNTRRIGCEQISGPAQALPGAVIVGLVAGVGLIVAAYLGDTLGRQSRQHPAMATLVVGATLGIAAGLLSGFVWSAFFRAVLCAPSG